MKAILKSAIAPAPTKPTPGNVMAGLCEASHKANFIRGSLAKHLEKDNGIELDYCESEGLLYIMGDLIALLENLVSDTDECLGGVDHD